MKKLTYLVLVLILGGIIISGLRSCKDLPWNKPSIDTVRVIDTVWQKHDTVIYKKMNVYKTIHDTVAYNKYLPDTNYAVLKKQYLDLVASHTPKHIYLDTIKLPGIKGGIYLIDTLQFNNLRHRSYINNYEIPHVKETITITKVEPSKRQFYLGGGISANQTNISSVQLGALYKTRKDWAFGVFTNINPQGSISYGVQSYWKISLFNRK